MFKRKIKTELEVFSEQRYKDAAVVVYHQLKKNNLQVENEKPAQGWINEKDAVSSTQFITDTPQNTSQNNNKVVEYVPGSVQSKFCTLM